MIRVMVRKLSELMGLAFGVRVRVLIILGFPPVRAVLGHHPHGHVQGCLRQQIRAAVTLGFE